MGIQKLRYLGTGPGQGEGVSIGGIVFHRQEIYEVDDDFAAILLRKGGFEVVRPQPKLKAKGSKRSVNHGNG